MVDIINEALKEFGGGAVVSFTRTIHNGFRCVIADLNNHQVMRTDANEPMMAFDKARTAYLNKEFDK